MFFQTTLQV